MAKMYFKHGVMGASKTADALMTKFRYEEIGKTCIFCKTSTDNRDGERTVKSRIGLKADNVYFLDEVLLGFRVEPRPICDVIIVDESQFATTEQIDALEQICHNFDIPVICYGLKTDFRRKLFEGSKRLLEIADKTEEIKQICWCGKKALFNARTKEGKIIKDGEIIDIGGDEKYVSLCRTHYLNGKIAP